MKPIFKVLADRIDITVAISRRLLSINTMDEAGFKSDTCRMELDDRDGLIELPRRGAKLEVYLGCEHTGLTLIGVYTVDEVLLSGFPETLSINAKAADMRQELKEQKTRHFDNVTLGDLVKTIAGAHGLTGKTAAELASVQFEHIDQTQESDLHLLTRLAKQYDAVAKITNDYLIVAKAGESKSISGASLPVIVINKNQASDYLVSLTDRAKYAAVTATWHNKQTGQNVSVSTSEEKPAYQLRHTYDDQQKAIEAAKAKLSALQRGADTIEVTLSVGMPELFAESPLVLTGFRAGVSGQTWTATRVSHSFSRSGFTTRVEGEARITARQEEAV